MSIKVIVGLILIATIVMIFYIKRVSSKQSNYPLTVPTNIDKIVPDSPVSFGYKCMWFAIKSDNKKRIAEILELNNLTDCNWQIGIDKAYNGSVFITPSINGWTLVCGWGLPHGDSKKSIDTVKSKLKILSKEFNEAQFFCSHRVTEYHCWIKSTKGHIQRVYSFLGEAGENIIVEGDQTEFEKTLKLVNTFSEEAKNKAYYENEKLIYPDEDLVMQVAEHWSINPSKLEERKDIEPSLGLLGQRK